MARLSHQRLLEPIDFWRDRIVWFLIVVCPGVSVLVDSAFAHLDGGAG